MIFRRTPRRSLTLHQRSSRASLLPPAHVKVAYHTPHRIDWLNDYSTSLSKGVFIGGGAELHRLSEGKGPPRPEGPVRRSSRDDTPTGWSPRTEGGECEPAGSSVVSARLQRLGRRLLTERNTKSWCIRSTQQYIYIYMNMHMLCGCVRYSTADKRAVSTSPNRRKPMLQAKPSMLSGGFVCLFACNRFSTPPPRYPPRPLLPALSIRPPHSLPFPPFPSPPLPPTD